MPDDELWHVRVSADEVKQLTLEQIDDLYRLDVIDADTQLWQDGMDEWLPLRVVAGLDEPEVVNISVPPTMPPKMGSTMSSWPPPAVAAPKSAASSWPPPVSSSARPAAPSSRPAAPSARPNAFAATAPWPSSAASSVPPPPAPIGLFSPSYTPPPASVRPQMITPVPFNYPRPLNPMPIILAAIVGLTITLYRNELLYAGARTVGQESNYLRLEAALGGPGFGTPRAVESMAKAAAALPDLPPAPVPTSTYKSSSVTSESGSSSRTTTATTAAATAAAMTKPASTSLSEAARGAAAPRAAQPAPVSRPSPAPRAEAEAPNPVFKQPKGAKRAKGNEFDPLNPSL
jgi:hypothetical protein